MTASRESRGWAPQSPLEMVRKRKESAAKRDLINAWAGYRGTNEVQYLTTEPGPDRDMMQRFHSVLVSVPEVRESLESVSNGGLPGSNRV
jgi:hypothetical protein